MRFWAANELSFGKRGAQTLAVLRLNIPNYPPTPLLGGCEVVGGCVALALEGVRDRMIPHRDRLAVRYRLPPDPAALPAARTEAGRRERFQTELNRHREYLRLAAAVLELDDAIRSDKDLEVLAVLFFRGSTKIERWSGGLILARQFVWAECRACERRYTPEECCQSGWDRVAGPRAGIGGVCLTCAVGHVIFSKMTWVA
jgi:hypothetical protein